MNSATAQETYTDPCLSDKTVLITGSSSGTGAMIARLFAKAGARVAVHARRDTTGAHAVCRDIEAGGGQAEPFIADLTDSAQTRRLAHDVSARLGPVAVLVNNAGPFVGDPFMELRESDWDEVMTSNLKAPWLLTRALAPAMIDLGWGRILNLGATSALVRTHAAYGLAKAALIHLTESLALELAPTVTVNAIVPSQIASPRTDQMSAYKEAAVAATPLGRLVTEAEIARLALVLCGTDFDFMTGRSIVLDGGRTLPRFPRLGHEARST